MLERYGQTALNCPRSRWGEVLAAGPLDEVLIAVGDAQIAVVREFACVAGMDPAVGLQGLGGLLGQPVVALHDAGPRRRIRPAAML
jgi:hypothetical protein